MGSGLDLSKRIGDYYKKRELNRNPRPIHAALLKYGYENFKLEILEYCEKLKCIEREQYYIDLIKPEYNILSKANSSFGYKHSEKSLIKLREHLLKLNKSKGFIVETYNIKTNEKSI